MLECDKWCAEAVSCSSFDHNAVTGVCKLYATCTATAVAAVAEDRIYEKQTMTEDACDKLCYENERCVEFYMIPSTTPNLGSCRMYEAGCTQSGSVTGQSCYSPTPNVKPSSAGLECTHRPKHNANKDERDACTAHRYEKTQCELRTSDCVYNAWQPTWVKEAELACNCGTEDISL